MLYQISPAIHSANPRAQVLIGGLAYDYFEEDNPSNPFVRDFLTDTLTALNTYPGGADTYLNAVAFHFYPISADRWPTIREKTWEIAGIMTNHGVGDLPLISPEMGYWSSSKHGSSEEGQARRLAQMYARSLSVGLHSLSWYKVFDDAVAGSIEDEYPDSTSGLLRLNGSKKPSYYAYQTMTEELHGAIYSRELGAAGAEGYVFDMLDGKEKTVVWSSSGTVHVDFSYSHVRLVDTQGNVFDIQDGDTTTPGDLDGSVNGVIRLEIHENQPYYVGQE